MRSSYRTLLKTISPCHSNLAKSIFRSMFRRMISPLPLDPESVPTRSKKQQSSPKETSVSNSEERVQNLLTMAEKYVSAEKEHISEISSARSVLENLKELYGDENAAMIKKIESTIWRKANLNSLGPPLHFSNSENSELNFVWNFFAISGVMYQNGKDPHQFVTLCRSEARGLARKLLGIDIDGSFKQIFLSQTRSRSIKN